MALIVGSRLAHYDVTALIGEGGMGPGPPAYRYEVEPQHNRGPWSVDRIIRCMYIREYTYAKQDDLCP